MTVEELIKELKQLDQEAVVVIISVSSIGGKVIEVYEEPDRQEVVLST